MHQQQANEAILLALGEPERAHTAMQTCMMSSGRETAQTLQGDMGRRLHVMSRAGQLRACLPPLGRPSGITRSGARGRCVGASGGEHILVCEKQLVDDQACKPRELLRR